MAYEYESDIPKFLKGIEYEHPLDLGKEIKEIQEIYSKAKAWDRMYELLIDKDILCKEFDDEMYELLKQTGKTDIRIITDPSIDLEDE